MAMSNFGFMIAAALAFMIVGTFVLDIGIRFAAEQFRRSGHSHLAALVHDRSFTMRLAMLAVIMTWPIVIAFAVIAARSCHTSSLMT